jgi:hypothetical protein
MGLSKLDTFILFHLFKVPAVIAIAGVGGLLCSSQVMKQAGAYQQLAHAKQSIDQASLDSYGHLLCPNMTLDDALKAHGLEAKTISTEPLQIETDLHTFQMIEKLGIFFKEASFASNKVTATINYPPKIK